MTALKLLNDHAGTLLTPAGYQCALSLIENRFGVKLCGATLLGLGPDYSVGMGKIGKNPEAVDFSEEKCREELVLLNQRAGTKLSLEELNLVLTLVNKRYNTLIGAAGVLEWLYQARKNKRLPWKDEIRGNIIAALAFLGAESRTEASLSDLRKTFKLLGLKGTEAQIMTVWMSMED